MDELECETWAGWLLLAAMLILFICCGVADKAANSGATGTVAPDEGDEILFDRQGLLGMRGITEWRLAGE